MKSPLLLLLFALAASARAQDNVLILLADDIGVDQLSSYGEGVDLPPTPNIDGLAASGVLFRNAWATPVCSPTRASILTGRFSFRTGVGNILGSSQVAPPYVALPADEITLPEMLDLGTGGMYAHAAMGKWHLHFGVGFELAPNQAGFSHFAGTPANLGPDPNGYFNWLKVVDGTVSSTTTYATTDTVDEALAWLSTAPEPWLCYVAFNSAHSPAHAPPPSLHTQDLSGAGPPDIDPRPYYKAMLEAMDTEIGRLLNGIGGQLSRTTVLFLGDNGTPGAVVLPPFDPAHAKQTMFEGGVYVPLFVSGRPVGIPGSESSALVHVVDIYATVAEIAGIDLDAALPAGRRIDGRSLVPLLQGPSPAQQRATVFTQMFNPVGSGPHDSEQWTIRGERYKLIRSPDPTNGSYPAEFYDLLIDPFETTDLLAVGLTPKELDAFRLLDRGLLDLIREAQTAGPSGSESNVVFASNGPASGGTSQSETYQVVSELGQPGVAPAAASAAFQVSGSTAWTTGGFVSSRPVIFGMQPNKGGRTGGDPASVMGFGFGALGPTPSVSIGGLSAGSPTTTSNTVIDLSTPSGTNALSNPIGPTGLALTHGSGLLLQRDVFAYIPALSQRTPACLGAQVKFSLSFSPNMNYGLAMGIGIDGVGVHVPPIQGTLELAALVIPLTETVGFSTTGEKTWNLPLPADPGLDGIRLQFQAIAFDPFAPFNSSWSNKLDVTFSLVP